MKKIIFILTMSVMVSILPTQAQYSRVTNAENIEALDSDVDSLAAQMAAQNKDLQANLDSLKANVESIIATGKEDLKVPTTVDEANALAILISSFVMFVLTGFIPKEKLPPWLSPFVISLIVGLVVTGIGYFASGGEFTLSEAITFFVGIAGGSNIIHQIKKPKNTIEENTGAPTPVPA